MARFTWQKIPEPTWPLVNKYIKTTIRFMKPVKQEDGLGCAVACAAFVLGTKYQNALVLFGNGKTKATTTGFYCKEIIEVLKNAGFEYEYRYIKDRIKKRIYKLSTIVFIKRSKRYPAGHYLVRTNNKWMDPWVNFPNVERKAGFRRRLPDKPMYVIYKS